jgi:hypothetical protein
MMIYCAYLIPNTISKNNLMGFMTNDFLMLQSKRIDLHINPKSKIQNRLAFSPEVQQSHQKTI